MSGVNHWKIFCNTEQNWVEGYLAKNIEAPTKCFNNTSHDVNLNSTNLIGTIGEVQEVYVKAEKIPSGSGSFRNEGGAISIQPNETKVIPYIWKKDMNMLNICCTPNDKNIGDKLDLIISPNTIIGVLRETANENDTILKLTTNYLSLLRVGYEVLLNGTIVGEAIEIDTNDNSVRVCCDLNQVFPIGCPFGFQIKMIKNLYIANNHPIEVGRLAVGPSFLPANTLCHVVYTNNDNQSKEFIYNLEYLY
jgi:hypothetical protein